MLFSEATVLSDRHGQHIAINRPDARNAINGDVAQALEAAVNEAEADERFRVAVLTGAGGPTAAVTALLAELRGAAVRFRVLIAVNGVYITFAMVSDTAEVATPGGKTPPLQPLPAR
jgi:enoyl-CoA hydratase/carnithine racemase